MGRRTALSHVVVAAVILGGRGEAAAEQRRPSPPAAPEEASARDAEGAEPTPAAAEEAEPASTAAEGGEPARADADELPSFEDVAVAERHREPAFRSARSVSVVARRDLDEQAPRTVPEALWEAGSIFVQQTSHGGGSPILRGLIGPQNLILVDGVRLNNSVYRTGPIQYLNLIDPCSVSRIEVLRGPGSVLYGSDAMGGVIELVPLWEETSTGREAEGVSGRALLRLASANVGRTAHGSVGARGRGFSVLGGLTYRGFDDLTGGRGIGRQPHSGYDHWSAAAHLSHQVERGRLAGWSWSLGYLMARIEDAGRTDKLRDRQSLQLYDNDDHLLYGRMHLLLPVIRTSGDVTVSYQGFLERKDSITLDEELVFRLGTVSDVTRADTLGLDLALLSRPLGDRLGLRYGAMWYQDWVAAERSRLAPGGPWQPSATAGYPEGSRYHSYGAYLAVDGSPLRTARGHEIRLGAGYRYHGMSGSAEPTVDLDDPSFTHDGHVFHGRAQYTWAERLNLAFTFSQGFRAPNLSEAVLTGDTGKYFHVPNPDLGPERSDTFELLARLRLWEVEVGVSAYVSLLHDLIRREEREWEGQTEVGGKPVAWNLNGGEGILWGTELSLTTDLGYGLSLRGAFTFTWGEEHLADGEVPLSRIPPAFGHLALRYQTRSGRSWRAFVETSLRFAGQQRRLSPEDDRDVRIPDGGTPSWATWNARAGVEIHRRYSLRLNVENITNEPYRYHGSGIDAAGTNAIVTGELRF